MRHIKLFEDFTFADLYTKDKWVELSIQDRSLLKYEVWKIVDIAYQPLGGHVRVSSPDAVINDPDLNFWTAVDIDMVIRFLVGVMMELKKLEKN